MTESQISQFRALRAEIKSARNAYHVCLAQHAPSAKRHKAEKACSAAMAKMEAFQASL
jgi:hypothetical protein